MGYGSKQWQDWVLDEEESLPLIEHAYKLGINTWDTVSGSHLVLTFKARAQDADLPRLGRCLLPRQIRGGCRKSFEEVQHPSQPRGDLDQMLLRCR